MQELTRLMVPGWFFWDRDFNHHFQPRKLAVDNLAAAIRLEHDGGIGWITLAAFAMEASAEPLPSYPGVICAPQNPQFDTVAFDRLLEQTYSDEADWAYPRADLTEIRSSASAEAAVIESFGRQFIRLFARAGSQATMPNREAATGQTWVQVVAPSGKTGFVAPGALRSMTAERLCYGKDPAGRWRIAGFVGTGN